MDLLYLVHLSLQIGLHWDVLHKTLVSAKMHTTVTTSKILAYITYIYHQIDRLVQATSKNMQEKFELDKDLNVGQLNHFEQRSRSKDF